MSHVVTVGNKKFVVADYGYSGVVCAECGHAYTDIEANDAGYELVTDMLTQCPECGNYVNEVSEYLIHVRPDSEHLLHANNVKTNRWFHATMNPDWLSTVLDFDSETGQVGNIETAIMVHIGSEYAAFDRAYMEFGNHDWYMYEVMLDADTEISSSVMEDDGEGGPHRAELCKGKKWSGLGATRYINAYESIGSISLLVNPHKLTVIDKIAVTADTEYEFLTLFAAA